jgi:DNA-binding transcriptional ArsR family regulator
LSSNQGVPDYDLDELRIVGSHAELRALADPLREVLLDLLLERAATVAELAVAVGRPKSTVAHHVGVLLDAGLVAVVRTRRVRAIDERFYGRTARVFYVSGVLTVQQTGDVSRMNDLAVAAAESVPAQRADDLRAIHRHARIAGSDVRSFWKRVLDLANEYAQLPRDGETTYAFVAGLYPTDFPALPPRARPDDEDGAQGPGIATPGEAGAQS